MAPRIVCIVFACVCTLVDAVPIITFPFNSQVPPVARVSESFQYTFSSSTFSSTLPLTYSLTNAPSWLSLDSSTRTLSGTPSAADTGMEPVTGVDIGIIAKDESGSVTLNATIVISKNPEPKIKVPLASQLPSFGTFSLPSTVLYHPSTPFKFSIDHATFAAEDQSSIYNYYAVTDDNTPLPSWITFDQSTLTFIGQTPDYASLIQPPQTFGMKLVASDVQGFAGASVSFNIKVGVHLFAFKNANMTMNFTTGTESSFSDLANNLLIDSQVAAAASIASINVQSPPWLSFDNTTLLLKGTPPDNAIPTNITVQATDIFGDTATANILVDISSTIFTSEVGMLNASAGTFFSFDLSTYLRNRSDIDMSIGFSDSIPWMHFNPQTFSLTGEIAEDEQPSQINLTMQATSKTTHISNTQNFALSIIPGGIKSSIEPTESTGTPTSGSNSPTTTSIPEKASHRQLRRAAIAGIVIATLAGLALLLLLAFLCYRRRKNHAKPDEEVQQPKLTISAPIEVNPSMGIVEKSTPIILPTSLQLDTTGFGTDNRSSVYSGDLSRKSISRSNPDNAIGRSRTYSGVSSMSGGLVDGPGNPAKRARSNSENALPRSESSANWRYTQDSSYPLMRSRANSVQTSAHSSTKRLSRTYSNYSRKGHTRRAGRIWTDQPPRSSLTSIQSPEIPILNLKDSNFSAIPLANFTVISKRVSIPGIPEVETPPKANGLPATRRNSRLMSPLDRTRSGIGHGSRESIDSLIEGKVKRRSLGHGQEWNRLSRDSRTWLTMDPNESEIHTRSNSSHTTESREMPNPRDNSVHLSPNLATQDQRANVRPISRRIIGSTPFFSGRTESVASRKSPKGAANTYSDPASPEQLSSPPQNRNLVRVKGDGRDSLGIAYASTRESTKQLGSYLQSHISRNNTKSSMNSTGSKDSRFESASPSMQSMQKYQRDGEGDVEMRDVDDGYEEFVPDNFSDGSWETHHESRRDSEPNTGYEDSQPNIVTYEGDSSVNSMEFGKRTRASTPLVPLMGTSGNARMMRGRGRRPMSVDTGLKGIGSVRGVLHRGDEEDDYTVYV